jgi:phosphoserine aminotransferase
VKRRIFNFAAGPAVLPEPVLEEAREAIWSLGDTGIGVLEHSHRGPAFTAVYEETVATLRELAGIPDGYDVLFLSGGASSQFFLVPMSFLDPASTADYLLTGSWGRRALAEAERFGPTHVACSAADRGFTYVPDVCDYSPDPTYVHFTSNETIEGVQFRAEPEPPEGSFLVCDASSDILSRPIDIRRYGIVYAGAQKNLGPAGVTLVVIRKDLVERARHDLPTMLQYRTHASSDSMYNTPSTFGIFVIGLVARWIRDLGGLESMVGRNRAKADRLYRAIDDSRWFHGPVEPASRSLMNVTFTTGDAARDAEFVAFAQERGLDGLKGHRSVGGIRASIYNAFPPEGVDALVDAIHEFEEVRAP